MELWQVALISAGCAVVFLIIGILIGQIVRKKTAEKAIGSAEAEAKRIREDASKDAERAKKESVIAAKEEILHARNESEKELKERRKEVTRLEQRVAQKEENVDKKSEQLDRKNEVLEEKIRAAEADGEKMKELLLAEEKKLEEVAGITAEEAKLQLFDRVESETRYELAQKMLELEAEFKEEADTKARNIISLSIQRLAAEFVSESTVSVVPLPTEELKGRIIGREGRNIQAIEKYTGCDLIIDDTPEAITLSCFDPVRREVARMTLEKLISDGRIHPGRIEETVEKCEKEVEIAMKQAGEKATYTCGVQGIHPDLIRMLGRLRYRTSYGQNMLRHSIEVSLISGMIADELGVDSALAKRAGLLHDIGKAQTHELEGSHVDLGVNLLKKYKERPDVIHAVEAHHGDVEPHTIVAVIVQAADAISAARPGARREDLENYIKRLEKIETIAKEYEGVEKAFAVQAGRELRVMVKPESVDDTEMKAIAREMAAKIQEEVKYPGQIKINVIRESRAVEYAK